MSTSFHAVLWIDHQTARILQFDVEHVQVDTVRTHHHPHHTHSDGKQGNQDSQTFYREVCDSLEGIGEVLVVGPQTGISDFKNFADRHRPQVAEHLVAFERMAAASEGQLIAKAREFFVRYDQMAGVTLPRA